jgi:hypothetical protein
LEIPTFEFLFSGGGRAIKFHSKQDLIDVSLIMATLPPTNPAEGTGEPPMRQSTLPPSATPRRREILRKSPSPEQLPRHLEENAEPEAESQPSQSERSEKSSLVNSQLVLEASRVLGSIRNMRSEDIHLSSTTDATSVNVQMKFNDNSSDDETIDERMLDHRPIGSDPEFQDEDTRTAGMYFLFLPDCGGPNLFELFFSTSSEQ